MNTFFTLINKTTKDTSEEYQRHWDQLERIMKPLSKEYALGAATRLTQKYFKQLRSYPIFSFAHEDGIIHVMFDNGEGSYEDDFMEDMLNMLIDKGEWIERTAPEQIMKYHHLMQQLKELKQEMKKNIVENYKKNKGKGRKHW